MLLLTARRQSDDKRIEETWHNRRGVATSHVGSSIFLHSCQNKVISSCVHYRTKEVINVTSKSLIDSLTGAHVVSETM